VSFVFVFFIFFFVLRFFFFVCVSCLNEVFLSLFSKFGCIWVGLAFFFPRVYIVFFLFLFF